MTSVVGAELLLVDEVLPDWLDVVPVLPLPVLDCWLVDDDEDAEVEEEEEELVLVVVELLLVALNNTAAAPAITMITTIMMTIINLPIASKEG